MGPNSFLKKLWVLIFLRGVSAHSPGVSFTNGNKDLLEKGEKSAVFSETKEIMFIISQMFIVFLTSVVKK